MGPAGEGAAGAALNMLTSHTGGWGYEPSQCCGSVRKELQHIFVTCKSLGTMLCRKLSFHTSRKQGTESKTPCGRPLLPAFHDPVASPKSTKVRPT